LLTAQNIEIKLFSKLFTTLFGKKTVSVYTENKRYQHIKSKFLKIVQDCDKSDIVLGVSKKCKDKPHFLLNYYSYKNDKNAIGAFYWRKGRPQLRLRKKSIKKYRLHMSDDFSEFLE
jgi:hypothetical protein